MPTPIRLLCNEFEIGETNVATTIGENLEHSVIESMSISTPKQAEYSAKQKGTHFLNDILKLSILIPIVH